MFIYIGRFHISKNIEQDKHSHNAFVLNDRDAQLYQKDFL